MGKDLLSTFACSVGGKSRRRNGMREMPWPGSLDQTFCGKVSEHVATIEGYMEGIDLPVGFNDNTCLKVSVLFES